MRESKGAIARKARREARPAHYNDTDIEGQLALLQQRYTVPDMMPEDHKKESERRYNEVARLMIKRVGRVLGFDNKYDGKGNRRDA